MIDRPYITGEIRKSVFDCIHKISQPGTKTTCKIIKTLALYGQQINK